MAAQLSKSNVLVEASNVLRANGYRVVRADDVAENFGGNTLLAEDEYGILALVVQDTAQEIIESWSDLQAEIVAHLESKLTKSDPKVWEGYLVLMTPSPATEDQTRAIEQVRLDTTRLRKLVITGENLETLADISAALLPMLPIEEWKQDVPEESLLHQLPTLLEKQGVEAGAVACVITAFEQHESMMQVLDRYLESHET